MALDLEKIKKLHDKAYLANEETRERGADDLVFYWLTQWDDEVLSEAQLAYRGEFNILRKAGRQILSDLESNPIQVDFEPKDEARTDAADVLDGLYRTDDNSNTSIEAYEVGKQESVVCGAGAWLLYTDFCSIRGSDEKQVIKRRPIHEANNVIFWDPNAKALDKSDANYVSVLVPYSKEAYLDLVEALTGERRDDIDLESFNTPEQSYVFPWVTGQDEQIYIVRFFHRKKITATRLTLTDPFGTVSEVWEDELENIEDEMLDAGFMITGEKQIKRWQVTQYIASGLEILDESRIAGEHLPVVPVFGEHAFVEGEEHWEGVTRLAKDPSRLRNFILSYIAEIASRSPRPKPIFFPEQIQGHEDMYNASGADNNYPYYLQNRTTIDGVELPIGPVAQMPEQQIPQAIQHLTQLTREAVEDVANPGVPQDVADPDVSGKAVLALQARIDQQSAVYQSHFKHAKRRDGEIYASMAAEVYDVPRRVKLTLPDGTKKETQILQKVVDKETGDIITIHDLRNTEFDVYSKIGPSYSSQKEQTIEKLSLMIHNMDPADPIRKVLQLKILQLMDGVDFEDVRDYVRKQLIIMGIRKPETPEEEKFAQMVANQPEKPDPNTLLAMAEMEKAKADQMTAQVKQGEVSADAQNEGMKRMIDKFKAQTDRMEALIKAQVANASISETEAKTIGQDLENASKIIDLQPPVTERSDEDLFKLISGGANA